MSLRVLLLTVLCLATFALSTASAAFYEKGAGVINLSSKNFDKLVLQSEDVWIVEFYAPWCGHCKNMIPEYKKAGKALKDSGVKLGAIDATVSSELGAKYGVQGYPTIKVFGADKTKPTEYEGGRKASDFIGAARKALKAATGKDLPKLKEEEGAAGGNAGGGMFDGQTDVVQLTVDNFDAEVLNAEEPVIVEFYAPWCGHCKNMAPEYKKAAKALKGKGVKIAALDATVHAAVSNKFDVQGFPTIKVFGADKTKPTEYEGGRKASDFIGAARKALVAMGKAPFEKLDEEASAGGNGNGGGAFEGSDVVELTDEMFEKEVLNGDSPWLVEFYAPWCGHCKNLAPEFKKAATELGGAVRLGAIDATVHSKYSTEYKVEGFPTIKFFAPKAAGKAPEDYNSGRNADAIVRYCTEKAELYPGAPVEVAQIKDDAALAALLEKKPTVGVFIVPHVIDTGAAGRNTMLEMFSRVATKARTRGITLGWIVGGEHTAFEEALGIYTNYPAFVVLNAKKLRYATLKGTFTEENIHKMIGAVFGGKLSTAAIAAIPKLSKNVPLWDGKDYVAEEEEEY